MVKCSHRTGERLQEVNRLVYTSNQIELTRTFQSLAMIVNGIFIILLWSNVKIVHTQFCH